MGHGPRHDDRYDPKEKEEDASDCERQRVLFPKSTYEANSQHSPLLRLPTINADGIAVRQRFATTAVTGLASVRIGGSAREPRHAQGHGSNHEDGHNGRYGVIVAHGRSPYPAHPAPARSA